MKFINLHNNYTKPTNGETIENTFITDGFLKDDPENNTLEVSFRLQKTVLIREWNFEGDEPVEIEVEKIKTIAETILVFDDITRPTMVRIGTDDVDLFKHIEAGNQITGQEEIMVGYPTYTHAQEYFLKENLGDKIIINPNLTALQRKLVTLFLLEGRNKNGRPIGFYNENIGEQFRLQTAEEETAEEQNIF